MKSINLALRRTTTQRALRERKLVQEKFYPVNFILKTRPRTFESSIGNCGVFFVDEDRDLKPNPQPMAEFTINHEIYFKNNK